MLRVIVPPEPIVEPSDLSGSPDDSEGAVTRTIQAVTEAIDGPSGWLGRALGEQTLELSLERFWDRIDLPCRPIIEVESITYLDADGAEQYLDEGVYRLVGSSLHRAPRVSTPSTGSYPDAVRIRYRAGYNGEDIDSGGTGEVPAVAKQAIILAAQQMITSGARNPFLVSDSVEGVGTQQFSVTDQAAGLIARVCEQLLQGLKVYA